MPRKRKPEPEPEAPAVNRSYPSAPTHPESRLDWIRRRNAAIAKIDASEYLQALAAQDERRGKLKLEQRES